MPLHVSGATNRAFHNVMKSPRLCRAACVSLCNRPYRERVKVSIGDTSLKARCTVAQEPWFSLNLYPYQRSQPPSHRLAKFRWDVIPDPSHPENVDLLEQDVLPLSSSNLAMFGSTVHVAVPADVISVLRERYGAKWTFPDPPPSYMSEHSPGVLYAAVGGVT